MTQKQQQQFNKMRKTLLAIAKDYQTPEQLRKESKGQFGLDFEEAIEMAYENIQSLASSSVKGVREIKIN